MRKKVIVTGVLGYVGSALVKLFDCRDYDVIGVDNNFVPEKVRDLIDRGFKFYQKDLFDIKDLLKNIDFCYHLGGITQVPQKKEDSTPEKDAEIHKVGTEATRFIIENVPSHCKIIFPSSHVVFENYKDGSVLDEKSFPDCSLAYPESKLCSEIDLFKSNKSFVICRLGSVYGYPAMRYRIVANLFAKMAAVDKKIKISNKNCYKPLIGILDCARGLKFLGENYNQEVFHLVNENLTINELAQICLKYVPDLNIEYLDDNNDNLGYKLSNEKLLNTGFQFRQNIENAIIHMICCWRS